MQWEYDYDCDFEYEVRRNWCLKELQREEQSALWTKEELLEYQVQEGHCHKQL